MEDNDNGHARALTTVLLFVLFVFYSYFVGVYRNEKRGVVCKMNSTKGPPNAWLVFAVTRKESESHTQKFKNKQGSLAI